MPQLISTNCSCCGGPPCDCICNRNPTPPDEEQAITFTGGTVDLGACATALLSLRPAVDEPCVWHFDGTAEELAEALPTAICGVGGGFADTSSMPCVGTLLALGCSIAGCDPADPFRITNALGLQIRCEAATGCSRVFIYRGCALSSLSPGSDCLSFTLDFIPPVLVQGSGCQTFNTCTGNCFETTPLSDLVVSIGAFSSPMMTLKSIRRVHDTGPGAELTALLKEMGATKGFCGECAMYALKMNRWGTAGCRERREEIVTHLQKQAEKFGWTGLLYVAARTIGSGLAFRLSLIDPIGSLVDEAIRRAEAKEAGS